MRACVFVCVYVCVCVHEPVGYGSHVIAANRPRNSEIQHLQTKDTMPYTGDVAKHLEQLGSLLEK